MVWCCVHRPSVIPLVDLKLLGNKMSFKVIILGRVHGKEMHAADTGFVRALGNLESPGIL